jgi:hypothetical protein
VTICHIQDGNLTGANNITVGEEVVPDHLAHGDTIGSCSSTKETIGSCSSTKEPTVTVETPTTCISTENGIIGYARFTLSGFPLGKVLIMGFTIL